VAGEAGAAAREAERRLKKSWQEWEIPREADAKWPDAAKKLHADWWQARIARQQEIDKSIAAKAEFEYLYDKPYDDKKKVRVAGPFTVESLSPHRVLGVDENDELIDTLKDDSAEYGGKQSFPQMILENLKTAGVQQAHKEDRSPSPPSPPGPATLVCAEGRYLEGSTEKRAAIFIGPEFGTVQRADLVAAAREAGDAGFDVLIACAFNYEAHATEFSKLGRIPVLKARMNADLHMAEDLKNTGKGNLFVIFGEPDITLLPEPDGKLRVKVNGVDVFARAPAKSAATAPTASPAGSSTPTTTKKASSSATPTSSAPTTPTAPSNHPQSRNQRRSLGHPEQRHLPPLRETQVRAASP
jgi:adenine-specific DNA-methyltransferase